MIYRLLFFLCSFSLQALPMASARPTDDAVRGGLSGTVRTSDGQPGMYVSVALQGTTIGTTTSEQGTFQLRGVPAGDYTLVVSAVGFAAQQLPVGVKAGETTQLPAIVLPQSRQQLQEVTVTAQQQSYQTKKPSESLRLREPLLEVPQNIQVVSQALLQDQQQFNITEGFTRNVSGITTNGGWTTINAAVTIRGSASYWGSFRNGMNLANFYAPVGEDLAFVDHIDVVKGPAGFLLSNGEAGGFYNVVTKKPTGRTGGRVGFTFGSYNTYRATADVQGKVDKAGKLLYRFNLAGQTGNSFIDHDFSRRVVVAPVLSYQLTAKTKLTAEYTFQAVALGQLSPGSFNDQGFKALPRSFYFGDPTVDPTQQRDHTAFLTAEHRFNDNWQLTVQGSYNHFTMDGQFLSNDDEYAVRSDGTLGRSYWVWDIRNPQGLGQAFVNGTFATGPVQHHLLAGIDLADKRNHEIYEPVKYGFRLNIRNPQYGLPADSIPVRPGRETALDANPPYNGHDTYQGYLVMDELRLFAERLRLTLGGRYTRTRQGNYDGTDPYVAAKFTPRVGLSYSLTSHQSIYGLFDNSFIPQGRDAEGNIFKPLIGRNLEAGWKAEWLQGKLSSTVAAYRISRINALTTDPTNPQFTLQTGETVTKGLEFDLTGRLAPGLNVVVNYAFTHSEITQDLNPAVVGTRTPGVAAHVANAWLSYSLQNGPLRGLGFNAGTQLQAHRYLGDYSYNAVKNAVSPDNFFTFDAGVNYRYQRVGLALLVSNLTDHYNYNGYRYGNETGTLYYTQAMDPRNFRLSVDYSF